MAGRRAADYDDALMDILVGGSKTYAQIGEALGLCETYVGKVARGERRPESADSENAGSPGEGAKDFCPHEFGRFQRPCAPNARGTPRRKSRKIRRLWKNRRRPKGT
jgi:hypothetical protein